VWSYTSTPLRAFTVWAGRDTVTFVFFCTSLAIQSQLSALKGVAERHCATTRRLLPTVRHFYVPVQVLTPSLGAVICSVAIATAMAGYTSPVLLHCLQPVWTNTKRTAHPAHPNIDISSVVTQKCFKSRWLAKSHLQTSTNYFYYYYLYNILFNYLPQLLL
jgi:hypothetical protein